MSNVKHVVPISGLLFVILLLLPGPDVRGQDSLSHRPPDELLQRARETSTARNFPESILYYKGYLRQRPDDDDVRNELARTLSWTGEYDSALAVFDSVLVRSPNNFDARFGRCQVLGWKNDLATATREAEALLRLYPRSVDLLVLAGTLHLRANDAKRALELYQRVLDFGDQNPDAVIGKCRALASLGRSREAIATAAEARAQYPDYEPFDELYRSLQPVLLNQIFVRYQNESFDVPTLTDHQTFQAQYYRTISQGLTLYAEADAYRRFDQNDRSFGVGAYYTINRGQSLYGYCLVSPDPKVTSSVDGLIEYTRVLGRSFSALLSYRLIKFTSETAHILTPGIAWTIPGGIELKPRCYISRTVNAGATSATFSLQCSYTASQDFTPYFFYTVGNEAYRGETLYNIESSDSWGMTIGCRFAVSKHIVFRANYLYLNRISVFRDNGLDFGMGYSW